jgi:hypothetical protein
LPRSPAGTAYPPWSPANLFRCAAGHVRRPALARREFIGLLGVGLAATLAGCSVLGGTPQVALPGPGPPARGARSIAGLDRPRHHGSARPRLAHRQRRAVPVRRTFHSRRPPRLLPRPRSHAADRPYRRRRVLPVLRRGVRRVRVAIGDPHNLLPQRYIPGYLEPAGPDAASADRSWTGPTTTPTTIATFSASATTRSAGKSNATTPGSRTPSEPAPAPGSAPLRLSRRTHRRGGRRARIHQHQALIAERNLQPVTLNEMFKTSLSR